MLSETRINQELECSAGSLHKLYSFDRQTSSVYRDAA